MGLRNLLFGTLPLNDKDRAFVEEIGSFMRKKEVKEITKYLRQKKISFYHADIEMKLIENVKVPQLTYRTYDTKEFVEKINKRIKKECEIMLFEQFSDEAFDTIPLLISPSIIGFDHVKKAVMLQLFSKSQLHILLLGDPGTGKTDIIREGARFAEISTFGLGSGTTGAGLVAGKSGTKIVQGLLPSASGGICAIDELNLMKEESRAGLYSAMEKGFVTYDRAGAHYKFDADVSILSTANPKGGRFRGRTVPEFQAQLPFEPALLTRFHLIFIMKKPDYTRFMDISKKIVDGKKYVVKKQDTQFIKDYIKYAKTISVSLPKGIKGDIIQYVSELKQSEKDFLVDISPRLVYGLLRMVKASARAELRSHVIPDDLERVKKIVERSLKLR